MICRQHLMISSLTDSMLHASTLSFRKETTTLLLYSAIECKDNVYLTHICKLCGSYELLQQKQPSLLCTVTLPVFKIDLPSRERLNGLRLNLKEKNLTMLNSTVQFRTFEKELALNSPPNLLKLPVNRQI